MLLARVALAPKFEACVVKTDCWHISRSAWGMLVALYVDIDIDMDMYI